MQRTWWPKAGTIIVTGPYYDDPVCCVATVCHRGQARCMYWEHLGHIHRAISHLKWCKIVRIRYLARTFIQMKSSNTFFMFFAIWSSQTFPLEIYCGLNIYIHCFHVYVYQCWPQTMQKHGYLECLHAASARENISWVWVISERLNHAKHASRASEITRYLTIDVLHVIRESRFYKFYFLGGISRCRSDNILSHLFENINLKDFVGFGNNIRGQQKYTLLIKMSFMLN